MNLRAYRYRLVDVFAERPFTGSPVAVFTDARGLDESRMRWIARELNRAQTTFVFPASAPGEHHRIRIFTPTRELSRAEQPTIGTGYALDCEAKLRNGAGSTQRVVLEDGDGPVSIYVFPQLMTVRQPLPQFGAVYQDVDAVMATLSLPAVERVAGVPLQSVSSGVPYLVVPIRSRAALERIRFRADIWERTIRLFEAPKILAFCLEPERKTSFAKMRVFTPDLGVVEDPATETACGPVIGYLAKYGLAELANPSTLMLEQGAELDRPSFLHVAVELVGDELAALRVGGQCVAVGEGVLHV